MLGLGVLLWTSAASPAASISAPLVGQASTELQALERDWSTALAAHREELRAAKDAGKKRREWPEDPAAAFYPRFEHLGRANEGRAVLWMAQHLRDAFSLSARKQAADRLLELVFAGGDAAWVAEVLEPLRQLRRELDEPRLVAGLELLRAEGRPLALRMSADMALGSLVEPENPARALELHAEACSLASAPDAPGASATLERFLGTVQRTTAAGDPALRALALGHARALATRWPGSDAAEDLENLLFRMENLCVGCPAPDFTSEDVEGHAFKLSDYRGKVTLIDFWGFW